MAHTHSALRFCAGSLRLRGGSAASNPVLRAAAGTTAHGPLQQQEWMQNVAAASLSNNSEQLQMLLGSLLDVSLREGLTGAHANASGLDGWEDPSEADCAGSDELARTGREEEGDVLGGRGSTQAVMACPRCWSLLYQPGASPQPPTPCPLPSTPHSTFITLNRHKLQPST